MTAILYLNSHSTLFPIQHISRAEVLIAINLYIELKTKNSYLIIIPSTRAEGAKKFLRIVLRQRRSQ
jgi:hypothetical protein